MMTVAIRTGTFPSAFEKKMLPYVPADAAAKYVVKRMGKPTTTTTMTRGGGGSTSTAKGARLFTSLPMATFVSTSTIIDWAAELTPKTIVRGDTSSAAEDAWRETVDPQEAFIARLLDMAHVTGRIMDKMTADYRTSTPFTIKFARRESRIRSKPKLYEGALRRYILEHTHVVLDKAVVGKHEEQEEDGKEAEMDTPPGSTTPTSTVTSLPLAQ